MMKVILTQEVDGLGHKLETREVADGYARNYLLPRGLAVVASGGASHQVEKLIEERDRKHSKEEEKGREMMVRLEGLQLKITARAGASGHLYGGITSQRIAEELSSQFGVQVDRRQIKVAKPIRELGSHLVGIKVAPASSVDLAVEVVAESA